MKEHPLRSAVKTVSWRVVATLTTILLVYAFTGELLLGISVGAVEMVAKLALYYAHERVWNRIGWGHKT